MTGGSEGMPKETMIGKSGIVYEFETTYMAVVLEVKQKLAEELSPMIYNKIMSWLMKIEDQGKRFDELSELRSWLLNQKQIQWTISEPTDVQSGGIEELARQIGTLAGEISSSMVATLTPEPTDPSFVASFLLYTKQLDPMCQDMKKMLNFFSTDDGADKSLRSDFTSEGNLLCLSNLLSISESIDTLRSLEPTLHHSLGKLVDEECKSLI